MQIKSFSGIVLILLLANMLTSAFIIQPVTANPGTAENERFVSTDTAQPLKYDKIDSTLHFLNTSRTYEPRPSLASTPSSVLDSSVATVTIRFTEEISLEEISELESEGVTFRTVGGKISHVGVVYSALVPWNLLNTLAERSNVVRIESAFPIGAAAPLDVSAPEIRATQVWSLVDSIGRSITGRDVTVAVLDTGIDWQHPDFYFADGGQFNWIDVNSNNIFDAFEDAVDGDRDGSADAVELLGFYEDTAETWLTPTRSTYDAKYDWLYNDANNNRRWEQGETVYVTNDANNNGRLDLGETIVALGTPKVWKILDDANGDGQPEEHIRGVNLDTALRDTNGHGTSVCGIIAGGQRNYRSFVGIAPDATLLVARIMTAVTNYVDVVPALRWAQDNGADVVLIEYGAWILEPLDGSSDVETAIDDLSSQGIVVVVPAGNLAGSSKHSRTVLPSGTTNVRFNVPSRTDRINRTWTTILWRTPANNLAFSITAPSGSSRALPGSGPPVSIDGHLVYSTRSTSPRNTAQFDIRIDRPEGVSIGDWTLVATNPAPIEDINMYITDDSYAWAGGAVFRDFVSDTMTTTCPSTADSAISVASYATRTGLVGGISWFSGRGPRIDGVQKPDIAAPGHYDVLTARSQFATSINGPFGTYDYFGGTSAAGPHVAGTAALIIQRNQNLSPSNIREIIRSTARIDSFVLSPGSVPNAVWGWGKIDALASVQTNGYAYTDRSQYAVGESVTVGFLNTGETTITLPNTAPWVISDALGRIVYSPIALQVLVYLPPRQNVQWQWNQIYNSGVQVPPGTYTFQISTSAGTFGATFTITTGPTGNRRLTTDPSTQDLPSLIVADTGPVLASDAIAKDVADNPAFQGYFLAYQSWETGEANKGDIFIEKYDKNWNRLVKVQATSLPSYQDSPSLALIFDGSNYYLKLAYVSNETGNYDIFVQTFDLDLNFKTRKQITSSLYDQDFPSIVSDTSQSIYIAYQSWETGSSYWGDIFIEKLNLNLERVQKIRVTSEASYQDCPGLLFNRATGIIYVAYVSDETGNYDIFLKQYDSNLNYLGKRFQLTTHSTTQNRPSLAPLFTTYPSVRGFQLAYHSWETGASNNRDIFVKEFDLDCNELRTIQITNDQFYSATPSITPSLAALDTSLIPSYIAYVSNETGNWDIWLQQLLPATTPNLSVFEPQINGLTVTVNGAVSPGASGTSITRIRWNWGDGYQEDRWFPASHTYTNYGDYKITVTAYQSDGQTSTVTKQIYQLTITVSPTGAGSTNPSPGNYLCNAGQSVIASATPYSGYSFDHWELDGSNVGSVTSLTVSMNRAHSLKAVFSSKPDLIISDISWSPANPAEGDNVTFTVYIKNQGTADAGSFRTAYYINGIKLGEWSISSLSVGQTTTKTFSWIAVLGAHSVKAFADSSYNVDEGANEGNNQREETFTVSGKPDLIISDISWSPSSPKEGENATFTVYIQNRGTTDAGSFNMTYYIDGTKLGEWSIISISTAQIVNKTFTWTAIYGTHTVKAFADSTNSIQEKDENNNQREESVTVTGRPDLVISSLDWSAANPVEGATVTFTITIRNNGTVNAGSFKVAYYIDGVKLGELSISSLNAGQNTTKTFTWSAVEGNHTVKAFADSSYNIDEKIETNNEREEIVKVAPKPKPDLIISNIYWKPEKPVSGDTVTFNVTIKNQGDAAADSFIITYYIDGAKLGEWSIPRLAAEQEISKTFSWTAVEGSHTVKVHADSNNNVAEEDETNNAREEVVGNQPPIAMFCCRNAYDYMNNSVVFMCESTCFNASQSYDPDGTITNYTWDFGDGNITTVTGPIVHHNYTNAGIYTVALNVTDDKGLWNTVTANVTVTLLGDVNNDGAVTLKDVFIMSRAFGSKRGESKWDEAADLDNNGKINLADIFIIARNFGKKI